MDMWDYTKLIVLAVVGLLAAVAANYAHDLPYMVNAMEVAIAAAITFIYVLRNVGSLRPLSGGW
jgi:cytochrome c oxidase cbb3-type subunit 1